MRRPAQCETLRFRHNKDAFRRKRGQGEKASYLFFGSISLEKRHREGGKKSLADQKYLAPTRKSAEADMSG